MMTEINRCIYNDDGCILLGIYSIKIEKRFFVDTITQGKHKLSQPMTYSEAMETFLGKRLEIWHKMPAGMIY